MSEWKEYKLGEIVELNYGKGLTENKRMSGNVPVYSSAGITGWHNEPLVNSEGLIIGRKGTIGKVYYSNAPFFCIDTAYYILPNEERYDLKFLFYKLKTLGLEDLNEDSAVPGLNRETVYSQDISLPGLPEQKAIASILSCLDDKIDLLHRQNATLEKMAETLFRQWFVERRPEPVEGKAKEEWEERTLDDILTVKGGSTPSTSEPTYWNGTIHWASPRDITNLNGIYLFDTERKITELGLSKISSGLLPKGTLLMSSRAPVGVLAFSEVPVAINQGYIAILDNKGYSKEFIYIWLKVNIDLVHSFSNGSTFMEISKSAFKTLQLQIPPRQLLNDFQVLIKPLFEKIKSNQTQIRTLTALRDTLLPKLMSGEIRVL
jgi:type I restriction enzyme S subunit